MTDSRTEADSTQNESPGEAPPPGRHRAQPEDADREAEPSHESAESHGDYTGQPSTHEGANDVGERF